MIVRTLATLVSIVFGFAAFAQPARVISGEHADFSRLVVLDRGIVDWTVQQVEAGYALDLEGGRTGFELGAVFDLIPRDRITDVTASEDGSLLISLGCDCRLEAFEIRQGLVIDIYDGPAAETAVLAKSNVEFEKSDGAPLVTDTSFTPLAILTPEANEPSFSLAVQARAESLWADNDWQSLQGSSTQIGSASMGVPNGNLNGISNSEAGSSSGVNAETLASFRNYLIGQSARAGSYGLIDLAEPAAANAPVLPAMADVVSTAIPAAEGADSAGPENALLDQITIDTVFDRSAEAGAEIVEVLPDLRCEDSSWLDISNWVDADTTPETYSISRSALAADLDQIDQEKIVDLARSYIFYSFGAEAQQIAENYVADDRTRRILSAMAQVMDGTLSDADAVISPELAGCASTVALWAFLSVEDPADLTELNVDAVVLAFSSLPAHLRRHLGPRIADRLVYLGENSAADQIFQAARRISTADAVETRVISAAIASARNSDTEAEEDWQLLAAGNSQFAVNAATNLLESRIVDGTPISRRELDASSALAMSAAMTAEGQALEIANLRAEAHAGNFLNALASAQGAFLAGRIDEADVEKLQSEIALLVAESAEEIEFLEVFSSSLLPEKVVIQDREILDLAVSRLNSLSLPQKANDLLSVSGLIDLDLEISPEDDNSSILTDGAIDSEEIGAPSFENGPDFEISETSNDLKGNAELSAFVGIAEEAQELSASLEALVGAGQ